MLTEDKLGANVYTSVKTTCGIIHFNTLTKKTPETSVDNCMKQT